MVTGLASFLLFAYLIGEAFSFPRPDPKATWVRQGSSRNSPRMLQKRSSISSSSCIESNTTVIKPPKDNIWDGLTGEETASVVRWLFQQTDLNLTTTDKAGEWDNTM